MQTVHPSLLNCIHDSPLSSLFPLYSSGAKIIVAGVKRPSIGLSSSRGVAPCELGSWSNARGPSSKLAGASAGTRQRCGDWRPAGTGRCRRLDVPLQILLVNRRGTEGLRPHRELHFGRKSGRGFDSPGVQRGPARTSAMRRSCPKLSDTCGSDRRSLSVRGCRRRNAQPPCWPLPASVGPSTLASAAMAQSLPPEHRAGRPVMVIRGGTLGAVRHDARTIPAYALAEGEGLPTALEPSPAVAGTRVRSSGPSVN